MLQKKRLRSIVTVNNIIFVNRYFYPDHSATSQMLSDLAFALASEGNRVSVITSRQTYDEPTAGLQSREQYRDVAVIRVWTTRFGRMNLVGRALDYISFYIATLWTLLRIVRQGDIIVAKTDPPLISVIAWAAARIKGARLINWLQDIFPEVAVSLGVLNFRPIVASLIWLRNLSLRGAVMNVVLGKRMQQHVCAQHVEMKKTVIVHNWVDGKKIVPVTQDSNPLRSAWGLQGKFIAGYSGNMGRAHEFDTIIGAMSLLRDEENIIFLFIGGGAQKPKLESALSGLGLKNYLFLPYQPYDTLSESLSVPDVHLVSLLPSLEGLIVPSKFYGIAAAGRPILFVGDPDGEIGRLVSSCSLGYCIPMHAQTELAEKLVMLRDKPEILNRMGKNGRDCFVEKFDKSKAINIWKELLCKPVGMISKCSS